MKLTGIEVFVAIFAISLSTAWAKGLPADAAQAAIPASRQAHVSQAKVLNQAKLPVRMTPKQASTLQAKYQVWKKAERRAVSNSVQSRAARAKSHYAQKSRTYGKQPLQRRIATTRKEKNIEKARQHNRQSSATLKVKSVRKAQQQRLYTTTAAVKAPTISKVQQQISTAATQPAPTMEAQQQNGAVDVKQLHQQKLEQLPAQDAGLQPENEDLEIFQ